MQIFRRDVEFGIDGTGVPRDWSNNDGFETTLLNCLSAMFPEGEKFFVDSVKAHRQFVKDPQLERDVAAFIGQEAMHGREHRSFNDIMTAHGYNAALLDNELRRFLKRVRLTLSPLSQLAVTCSLEHFTAMLAEGLLSDPKVYKKMHPEVARLWQWHALEESEHKSVAFDVYQASGGTYAHRTAIMVLSSIFFVIVVGAAHAELLKERGLLKKPWKWGRGLMRLWIYPALFTKLTPAYLAYYKPGFHPSDRDTSELVAKWRQILFGDTADKLVA